jgi:hypothetical protein
MALVPFEGRQVGFWVVPRSEAAAEELPAGLTPTVLGEPLVGHRALIVAAAEQTDAGLVPVWAVVLHEPVGAALLVTWDGLLFAGFGTRAVLLDRDGRVVAERRTAGELVTAWTVPGGLLVFGRGEAMLLDRALAATWTRNVDADSFHLLDADADRFRLAAMGQDDWREIELDARSGAER